MTTIIAFIVCYHIIYPRISLFFWFYAEGLIFCFHLSCEYIIFKRWCPLSVKTQKEKHVKMLLAQQINVFIRRICYKQIQTILFEYCSTSFPSLSIGRIAKLASTFICCISATGRRATIWKAPKCAIMRCLHLKSHGFLLRRLRNLHLHRRKIR